MTLTLSNLAWRSRAIAALMAMVLAVGAAVLLQSSSSAIAGTSGAPSVTTLSDVARTDPTRPVEVIVQFAGRAAFAQGRTVLAVSGAKVTRDLHIINAYGARLSAGAAQRLAANPLVRDVTLNHAVKTSNAEADATGTSFLESTGVDKIWDGIGNYPGSGRGVTVAVIDTGIAGSHPDFRTSPRDGTSRVIASAVTNPDATTEDDTYGHGTHVAGLIGGNSRNRPAGDPLRGKYMGAAPNANLVSVKVSDDQGATSLIDVIYGLQYVVDNKSRYGIDVVNLSLTSATAESYKTDPLDAAAESAWLHGIVVVAAAGNSGTAPDAVSYAPGNDPYVISVGAVDTLGTKRTGDDALASWSSRGVTQDGVAKPDLVAPGSHIVGPYAPNSAFGSLCPTCIVDGQYFRIGGTSMSAAIVSGIVADLLQLHPDWTPDQVKGALVNNLRKIDGGGKVEVDAGRAAGANRRDLVSNVGLTPSTLIDPATGDIDYTRASWSRASWSEVTGSRASWSRASWSRASWSRASWSCDCALAVTTGGVDSSRASWSRASWSRASWSRASWSASFAK
jgi:serine protease AprX